MSGGEDGGDAASAGRRWYSVRRDDFRLSCDNLADVCKQHSRIPFLIYALYRLVFALYFVGFLIYFGVASADFLGAKFFIYLTDLTYLLTTFYLCQALLNVILDRRKLQKRNDSEDRVRYQIQWLLLNLCAAVSVIVTIVYWSALRPLMDEKLPIFLDVNIHLLPTVAFLIDISATAVVIRFVHVVYPIAYLFAYLLFAVIYWAAGGTDILGNPFIYPIIDFGNYPGIAAASIVGVCLVTILTQAMLKGFYVLRVRYLKENPRHDNIRSHVELETASNNSDLVKELGEGDENNGTLESRAI